MKRYLWLAGLLIAVAANTGCVERRFLVTSDPPGAMLYVNGNAVGPTPCDVYYTYYGKYRLTLVKDNCETLQVEQKIPTPWYEWLFIDFITENIYPFKVRDVRAFHYSMQPSQGVRPDDVLNRGRGLRDRSQTITPLHDAPSPSPSPAPTLPLAPPQPPPGAPPG